MIDAATLSQASLGFGVLAGGNFDTCFRELFPRVARTAALVSRDPGLGPDVAQEAFAGSSNAGTGSPSPATELPARARPAAGSR
jgi:hypothetical protein